MSGQEPISIRLADTVWGSTGDFYAEAPWDWSYHFDTGDPGYDARLFPRGIFACGLPDNRSQRM